VGWWVFVQLFVLCELLEGMGARSRTALMCARVSTGFSTSSSLFEAVRADPIHKQLLVVHCWMDESGPCLQWG
jgi:hypothetical protein